MEVLDNTSIPHELFEYTFGGHNITGSSFNKAMERVKNNCPPTMNSQAIIASPLIAKAFINNNSPVKEKTCDISDEDINSAAKPLIAKQR